MQMHAYFLFTTFFQILDFRLTFVIDSVILETLFKIKISNKEEIGMKNRKNQFFDIERKVAKLFKLYWQFYWKERMEIAIILNSSRF